MKGLIKFLQSFLQNYGLFVFLSFMIEKLIMLINTIFIVKIIPQDDFGKITLIASILAFMSPWNGFGSLQILMKFGSSEENQVRRDYLSNKLLKKGIINQIILVLIFILIANLYTLKFENLKWIILLFAIRLFGQFFQSHLTINYRINGYNKKFSFLNIFINCVGLLITFFLTLKLSAIGYMISLAITPFISLFFFDKNLINKSIKIISKFDWKNMWKYGRMESLAYFLSELLFSIDIAMIAFFTTDKNIALYKVAIILPMNLLIIPIILFQTDFPRIIKNSNNKKFLKTYIYNYYKLFIPISFIIILGSFLLKDFLIKLFFNDSYLQGDTVFFISTLTVVSAILFRVLYLNLFSAIGKFNWSVRISIISILCLILFDSILIPFYKIEGAAIGFLLTFLISGLYARSLFKIHLNDINN